MHGVERRPALRGPLVGKRSVAWRLKEVLLALVLCVWCMGAAQADTLYRCKTYAGGVFWSRAHCQTHGALIDRIATVPGGMGLSQQVKLAEQGARSTAREVEQASTLSRTDQAALQRQARAEERRLKRCGKLQAELERQDSRARQGLSVRQRARWQERQQEKREEQARAGC